jgi:hypothetical protein
LKMYAANRAVLTFFLPYKKPCIAYQNNSKTTSCKVEINCMWRWNSFQRQCKYFLLHIPRKTTGVTIAKCEIHLPVYDMATAVKEKDIYPTA